MAVDIVARALAIKNAGGTGGTTNYNQLTNKPSINNIALTGNKTSADLGLVSVGGVETISGLKTFTTLPESSIAPTTDNQLVNKAYVDDLFNSYTQSINAQLATLTTPDNINPELVELPKVNQFGGE